MSEHKCEFEAVADQFFFLTKCDGGKLVLSSLAMAQEQATNLAYLINSGSGTKLKIIVDLDEPTE